MPRSEQKQQTRQRILEAAGRSFRREGYDGVGVDGLSKEAGVTSGAFYTHFDSKAAAFRESVVRGVAEVMDGVRQLQDRYGAGWWREFVRFYLGEKRECQLAQSCGLQSLTPEVARADGLSRRAFTAELLKVAEVIAMGPKSPQAPASVEEAYAALSALIGAVTLARAVDDPALARRIAAAAERSLLPEKKPARRAP